MSSRLHSFETYRYTNAYQGYPCLAPVSQNELIVGDWSGNLFFVTVSPFAVSKQVFVASKIFGDMIVKNMLRSLTISSENPMLCAVATRGNGATVWDCGKDDVIHLVPDDGLVNAVAWLQNDQILLLGMGDYPLSPGVAIKAQIEAWKPDKYESSFVCRVALPGVSVDAISVSHDEDGNLDVVAFSGMNSQNRGFISILDNMLVPKACFELPFAMVKRLECTEKVIFVSDYGSIHAFRRDDGSEIWSHDGADFAYDPYCHKLFLSHGELISPSNGRVEETWPVLPDCYSVRPRPEGGFFGVSTTGIIGVWNVNV
jgi:hypothetical protein